MGASASKRALNPTFVEKATRPHLVASLAFGVPLIDRCNLLHGSYGMEEGLKFEIMSPLHERAAQVKARILAGEEAAPLPALMRGRARALLDLAKEEQRYLDVMWSGGMDSTAALIAIVEAAHSPEEIADTVRVRLASRSLQEYGRFYLERISSLGDERIKFKSVDWIMGEHIFDHVDDDAITVTGEGGDQLFGSSLIGGAFNSSGLLSPAMLEEDWERHLEGFLVARFTAWSLLENSPIENFDFAEMVPWLRRQLVTAPRPIETTYDLLWWLNFSCKWQHVGLRCWTRRTVLSESLDSVQHFYMTPAFEDWTMMTPSSIKMPNKSVLPSYKAPLKDYIFSFTGDADYRDSKIKIGSLRQRDCRASAILGPQNRPSVLGGMVYGSMPQISDSDALLWLSLLKPEIPTMDTGGGGGGDCARGDENSSDDGELSKLVVPDEDVNVLEELEKLMRQREEAPIELEQQDDAGQDAGGGSYDGWGPAGADGG